MFVTYLHIQERPQLKIQGADSLIFFINNQTLL